MRLPERLPELKGRWLTAYKALWFAMLAISLTALTAGQWREQAEVFDRALLFFEEAGRAAARQAWRLFDGRTDVTREFHELENGRWVHKA